MFITLLKFMMYAFLVVDMLAAILLGYVVLGDVHWYRRAGAKFGDLRTAYKNLAQKTVIENKKLENDIKAAKHRLLREKEENAANASNGGFFEEPYAPGFFRDGNLIHRGLKVPTPKAFDYYRQMEQMDDTQTMAVLDLKEL